jgi:hypothetical protein
VDFPAIFTSKDTSRILTVSKVCRHRSLLRSLPSGRWSSCHLSKLPRPISRSKPMASPS